MTAISQKEYNMSKYNLYVEGVSVEAVLNKLGGVEGARRFLRDELVLSEAVAKRLLERLSTIAVPAVAQFTAKEKFRPGKMIDGIKVGWLGDNFKEHFLPKVEHEEVAAEELTVNKLLEDKRDPAIITALGGEEKVEVSLGQFWEFLKTADQSFWYVAYIKDTEDVLWAVHAYWDSDGLFVEALPLGNPDDWDAGSRFLSR